MVVLWCDRYLALPGPGPAASSVPCSRSFFLDSVCTSAKWNCWTRSVLDSFQLWNVTQLCPSSSSVLDSGQKQQDLSSSWAPRAKRTFLLLSLLTVRVTQELQDASGLNVMAELGARALDMLKGSCLYSQVPNVVFFVSWIACCPPYFLRSERGGAVLSSPDLSLVPGTMLSTD